MHTRFFFEKRAHWNREMTKQGQCVCLFVCAFHMSQIEALNSCMHGAPVRAVLHHCGSGGRRKRSRRGWRACVNASFRKRLGPSVRLVGPGCQILGRSALKPVRGQRSCIFLLVVATVIKFFVKRKKKVPTIGTWPN